MDPRRFVEKHVSPFDPETDDYNVPALTENVTSTRATAVYAMHSYHQGKKPHDALRQFVRHYTRPGELVLDPFCGSGGTALAAVLEGRRAVALDRSPAAVFIANHYCKPIDPVELQQAFRELAAAIEPEMDWLYETRCDRCGGKARTAFTVFSERFLCPRCRKIVPLLDCVAAEGRTAAGRPKKISVCPHCQRDGHVEEIRTRSERRGAVPVASAYVCAGGCTPARSMRRHDDPDAKKRRFFRKYDLGKIEEIAGRDIPHWYPTIRFPPTFARWKTDLRPSGIESVADLYTKRNLWALAAIRARAAGSPCEGHALFALTAVCLAVSKMQRYSPGSGFPNMLLVGTYYVPPIGREIEVGTWYQGKLRALLRGYAAIGAGMPRPPDVCIAPGDARQLPIPSDSIDYIFTDPPYADAVQYGELNFVWESWLGAETGWHGDEIVVNASRGKTEAHWAASLRLAMDECYRVLKPGRWLSLCYHDTAERRWAMLQDLLSDAGFAVDASGSAVSIDAGRTSFNQFMTDKATKRDLVVSFRKPRSGRRPAAVAGLPAAASPPFEQLARPVLREFLTLHPGATRDRIYDDLVSRMIRRGQMQDHNFDALLRSVAVECRVPLASPVPAATGRVPLALPVRNAAGRVPLAPPVPAAGRWYLKGTGS